MVSKVVFSIVFILLSFTVCMTMADYTASYSGQLTTNSPSFSRDGATGSYYYQAVQVRVTTTGTYTFSTSSSISDTYGYLYQGNFYPSYPQYNQIASDDDGSGGGQFKITANLRSDLTYILIFTTYSQRSTGTFTVNGTGPGVISYL